MDLISPSFQIIRIHTFDTRMMANSLSIAIDGLDKAFGMGTDLSTLLASIGVLFTGDVST
jgi:hypothetical protein